MKRKSTKFIVIHCSATPPSMDIGVETLREWHKKNGWSDVGYHIIIRRDGTVQEGRPIDNQGAHVAGYNHTSIGIVMIGGVGENGKAENNFTPAQFRALSREVKGYRAKYPGAHVLGHRDLSPDLNGDGKITSNEWIKECPSFDVSKWMREEKI